MAMTTWSLIPLLLGETDVLEECVEDKIHKYKKTEYLSMKSCYATEYKYR